MLLPCGIDVFSGVEFVCCPAKKARKERVSPEEVTLAKAWPDELKLKKLDDDLLGDEDDYEDDYKEDDKDTLGDIQVAIHFPQDEASSSTPSPPTLRSTATTTTTTTTTTTSTARPTADPYFTHYDPRDE